MKPEKKPVIPNFSSGPCAKRPGYKLDNLKNAPLGRSHRSSLGKARLQKSIEETKRMLGIPADYLVGIVPASDTGAMEMALWSLLGPRGIDVLYWESFGKEWADDIQKQLKLPNIRVFQADYGKIPDLKMASPSNDIVFVWNGTTSGVKVPDGDWISDSRDGLTICDATSAVFAMNIPWNKLDVVTFSWQKVLGGEAGHGMLVLSPRAVKRLETFTPAWPLPKIFRMTKKGEVMKEIFEGSTINTPSMLCNEDYLDALAWADGVGGLKGLIDRSNDNLKTFEEFVKTHDWIHFLAETKEIRSNTSVCFKIDLAEDQIKVLVKMLEKEGVANDCGAYREAPAGLRFWCGATVERSDIEMLLPWLEWAYEEVKASK